MTQVQDHFDADNAALRLRRDDKLLRAADFAFRVCVAVPVVLLVGVYAGGWIASLLG